jgi:Transposase and inactivated derivatives
LADEFWTEIPQHFPFVNLDEFVIMPNHTHGILVINNNRSLKNGDWEWEPPIVDPPKNHQMQKISPKPGSISTIIRSFKSVTTKHARKIQPNFAWQPRFHDHIIRNQLSHNNIRNYIKNNPKQWKEDRFYDGL